MENRFYTCEEYFVKKFHTTPKKYAFQAQTRAEFESWKADSRQALSELIGLSHMERCPADPHILSREDCGTFSRIKMTIETEPGIVMPFYVLKPHTVPESGRYPVVIAPHGHTFGAKESVAGVRTNPAIARQIDACNCDYGVSFVKRGALVFCPDARGMGERREKGCQRDDQVLDASCEFLNHLGLPFGITVAGMWVWDLMRLIDYVQTRTDADCNHMACVGLSGGGLQTLFLTALDDRIKCCAISGYFYGFKEAHLQLPNCSCNYIPHLYELCDMGDIGALIAPRPVIFETGSRDSLNGASGLENVTPQVETVRKAASLFTDQPVVRHHIYDGPHVWSGTQSVDFIMEHLLAE